MTRKKKSKLPLRTQKLLEMAKQLVEKHPTKPFHFRVPISQADGKVSSTTALQLLKRDMLAKGYDVEIVGDTLYASFPVPKDFLDNSDIDTT